MGYYIINDSYDYADEFDYPVVSVMEENERDLILNTYNIWKKKDYDELYFGTNEYLSFRSEDILKMIKNAEYLDETEYKYFQRFCSDASLDIVDRINEYLWDHFGNSYDKIIKMPYKEALEKYPEYFV